MVPIMTPQELLAALQHLPEVQGQQLLQQQLPLLKGADLDYLVFYIKREADRSWNRDVKLSFRYAGYLLFIADKTRNKYYHALGLMARGDALRRMNRDQEALPFLDAAGEEFLELHDEVSWARTRIGRVSACLRLNRTTEALRDAEAARNIFIRHGKFRRAGQIDVNAAVINYELGQYDQALRLFDRAIEAYQRHGEGVELYIARAQGNKGLALAALGRFREALALHKQARATFAAQGESQEISVAREDLNIADSYAAQGYYGQALLLFNQSYTLFLKHHMNAEAAEVAQQMCLCLIRLNRTSEAYALADKTVQYFRSAPGNRHNLARSLMHRAIAATLEGKWQEADEMLQEASDLLEEAGLVRLGALARLYRAELYCAQGQLAASQREAQYVADVFAEQEDLPQLARTMFLQARIAEKSGDQETARDLCTHALDIARGQELLDLAYACEDLLGQLAEQRGELDKAAHYYERAIQGIDDVQSRLVLDERTSFLEDKGGIYQRAILLALHQNRIDQALTYVEKSKSRVLGDYLRNNIDIRLRAGDKAGEAILEDLSRLREEQAWFSSIVHGTEDEINLSDTAVRRIVAVGPAYAKQELQKREQQIERLLEQMQLRAVGDLVARQRSRWTQNSPQELLPSLDDATLMLEYYLSAQDIYIFQVTRAGVEMHTLTGAIPQLERLFSLWRANLDMASQAAGLAERAQAFFSLQENCLGLLQRLYDLLLGPVAPLLSSYSHMIVVPYGLLHYLPFHCLFDGVQFVVEQHDLSYLPAMSLLDVCRQRGQRIREKQVPLSQSLVLGLADGGKLAFAVREAEAVARQLGVEPVLDDEATTTCLWQRGARSPIVHIAAHGLFRLDAPNFSFIKLADRSLNAIEVFNLDLSSCSLVTLSACETGRGAVRGVDEVIGLGRGFLYAGAASLLPTLWKVDDASSAELMEVFYQFLLSHHGKASALAQAQRAFLERARTSIRPYRIHPYFWGAFHLIGDYGEV
jgi:CHAT domain-containing protein